MAVNSTDTVAGPFAGNGITTSFPFTFTALDSSEVGVLLRSASGDMVPTSGVSVSLSTSGGTATITPPPPAGVSVYVFSDPDFDQQIEFSNGGRFLADTVNEANDRAAVRDLKLREGVARAFTLPIGETAADLPPAAARAGKVLGFDSTGAPVVVTASGASGSVPASGQFVA